MQTRGFSPSEAGNLVAYQAGLTPAAGGWAPREIAEILFLRWLVDSGRLTS